MNWLDRMLLSYLDVILLAIALTVAILVQRHWSRRKQSRDRKGAVVDARKLGTPLPPPDASRTSCNINTRSCGQER